MSSRTINDTTPTTPTTSSAGFAGEVQIFDSYDDMELKTNLLRGVYAYGWETPTCIQERAIKPFILGRDLIAQAQSGKGKTGAFCIGSLQIVDTSKSVPQVLILSPARELARQSHDVLIKLATYVEGLNCHLSVGGNPVRQEISSLGLGPQIIVGTPGRILHMLNIGALKADGLLAIVLDEADEMLDRGFRDPMYDIFAFMPQNVQVCLFSATFPPECLELSNHFMNNPIRILVKTEALTLDLIQQFYVDCDKEVHKFGVLKDLYELVSVPQVIIFCGSRDKVDILAQQMTNENFVVSSLHGQMSSEERQLKMREFRTGSSRVLISTDLIARGIDIPAVSLVVNYDLPHDNYENYLHRIGRSGRSGKRGVAISLLTTHHNDVQTLRGLEQFYCTQIGELPGDVCNVLNF